MRIEKEIPLSDFERAAQEKSNNLKIILVTPYFIYSRLILKNLEKFRKPTDIAMPIIPSTKNKIEHIKHELPGTPNPVRVAIFKKANLKQKSLPLFLFIHGGGFLGGDSIINEGLMRLIADELDIIVATVDYNVSPEVTFPVPLNECHEGLDFILKRYSVNPTQIFLAGDSAGGNLAATLTLKLLDAGRITPKGQILLYPVCDFTNLDTESYRQKGAAYALMRKGIRLSRNVYVPDKKEWHNPYVSPQCAEFTSPQPDSLVLVADCDGLRSDGLNYSEKLEAANTHVRTVLYKGAYHSFINDLHRSEIADDAANEILSFIKQRIEVKE